MQTLDPIALAAPLVDAALAEDVGRGDVTSAATVPADARAEAVITAKAEGVLAGLPVARMVFERVDPSVVFEADAADGDRVTPGTRVARIRGRTRGLLTAERTALNFLQHLSGIATATARAVAELEGTGTRVLDTGKTIPGMRLLAKYAVRCGGGQNHRRGLDDMILIKENHVTAAGGIAPAIRKARTATQGMALEIEVTDRAELEQAAAESPDRIMLDNFTPDEVREALAWIKQRGGPVPEIEVSGGLTPETARAYAAADVDFISMGAITHSAPALDLSLDPGTGDVMTPEQLQLAFRHSSFVRHFFYYPSIGSTNVKAKELAERGAEEGTLVIADAQTEGRGRNDREWYSPPGLGLYVSFIFRPGTPAEASVGLLMAVALGAASAVDARLPSGVTGIKWPNDLLVEGRKLSGMLSEVGIKGGVAEWCVVGIGLNVNHEAKDFPPALRDKAVSLRQLCHREIDRVDLLRDMVERVAGWYGRYLEHGPESLIDEWRGRSTLMGRLVRVETAGEAYVGTAVGMETDGALRVRLESGIEEVLHAGDVHLVQVH